MWRRHQPPGAEAISVSRARAVADRHAHRRPAVSRGAGRRVDDHRVGRSGGVDDSARRIRCAARRSRVRSRRGTDRRRRHRARVDDGVRRRARSARRPPVRSADRDCRRRRAQRDRAAARAESRVAGVDGCARHDGGDAARDAARCRSVDAVGFVRASAGERAAEGGTTAGQGASPMPVQQRVMRTFFRSAITSTSASATCSITIGTRSTVPPYDLQREFVDHLRRRGVMEGESVRSNFTPFIIPVGGPLGQPGRGRVLLAGDAGGFVNGFTAEGIYYAMVSGDLAARAIIVDTAQTRSGTLARRYQRAVRREDRRRAARLRADSAVPVCGPSENCRRHRRRVGTSAELTRLILDFAVGRLSYRGLAMADARVARRALPPIWSGAA